jgi:hypothetical protein
MYIKFLSIDRRGGFSGRPQNAAMDFAMAYPNEPSWPKDEDLNIVSRTFDGNTSAKLQFSRGEKDQLQS